MKEATLIALIVLVIVVGGIFVSGSLLCGVATC